MKLRYAYAHAMAMQAKKKAYAATMRLYGFEHPPDGGRQFLSGGAIAIRQARRAASSIADEAYKAEFARLRSKEKS